MVIKSFTTGVKVIACAASIWHKIEMTHGEIASKNVKFFNKALA